ncbi:hypothetical protein [Akkermansia muciniphila]|uniref:hypothetical protein n=1 Tax=Akkermansia muciniphila TaxID=239935 RepID=UPI001BFF8A1A|nr:hypothetical protein [Akkermansia muciniphila]MBT8777898.1 hypothetical protein [Akkermansia muciniphila]
MAPSDHACGLKSIGKVWHSVPEQAFFQKNEAPVRIREQYLIALKRDLFLYIGLCSANPK